MQSMRAANEQISQSQNSFANASAQSGTNYLRAAESEATKRERTRQSILRPVPFAQPQQAQKPQAKPSWTPAYEPRPVPKTRQLPLAVKINRVLKTTLISLCGLVILGYGLDVATSSEVSKLQEQARRLSEQNTELSAQLLRLISFQGIQASVVGQSGLRVPDQVIIQKETQAAPAVPFEPQSHHLPLLTGY